MKRPRTTTDHDRFAAARLAKARRHERIARDARRRRARRRRMANGDGGLPRQRVAWHRTLDAMDALVEGFHTGFARSLRRGTKR